MAVGYTYPSVVTKQYIEKIDDKMKSVFGDVGIKNGAINIQCFTDGNDFIDEEHLKFNGRNIDRNGEIIGYVIAEGIDCGVIVRTHPLTDEVGEAIDIHGCASLSGIVEEQFFSVALRKPILARS